MYFNFESNLSHDWGRSNIIEKNMLSHSGKIFVSYFSIVLNFESNLSHDWGSNNIEKKKNILKFPGIV